MNHELVSESTVELDVELERHSTLPNEADLLGLILEAKRANVRSRVGLGPVVFSRVCIFCLILFLDG